jgi:hypothetical protein
MKFYRKVNYELWNCLLWIMKLLTSGEWLRGITAHLFHFFSYKGHVHLKKTKLILSIIVKYFFFYIILSYLYETWHTDKRWFKLHVNWIIFFSSGL